MAARAIGVFPDGNHDLKDDMEGDNGGPVMKKLITEEYMAAGRV